MLFFRLFRKVDPNCAYCRHGTRISERDVVCLKHGAVPVEYHCRAFRYDPLKRTPPRPAILRLGGLGEADFSLDGAVPGQETLFAGMDGLEQSSLPEAVAERKPEEAAQTRDTVEETPDAPEKPGESENGPDAPETPEESENGAVAPETPEEAEDDGDGAPSGTEEPSSEIYAASPENREIPASRTEKTPVKVKVRKIRR